MEKLEIKIGKQFKKDIEKVSKQKKNITLLYTVLNILQNKLPLEQKYKDHQLQGKLKNYRDLHIEPDWLLLYRVEESILFLYRTGSHSELFKKR